ncbi:MAG: DUF502 domain-containing protein, partial [Planctomycetota bacterium]
MSSRPARKRPPSFGDDFRKFFLRGLAILMPSLITLALVFWAYDFLYNNIASPINSGVRQAVIAAGPPILGEEGMAETFAWYEVTDEERAAELETRRNKDIPVETLTSQVRAESLQEAWTERWYLEAIGFVIAIILVYLAGVLVGNYLGRNLYTRLEGWLVRLPVIKQVYPNVKQVTDFLLPSNDGSDDKAAKLPTSGRVVLVEYPRKGIWTVGLLTGDTLRAIEEIAGTQCVTVFIPSSPTPFTGYTITVPGNEVHELPISFDEAIRFVVSGGVLVPADQQTTHRTRGASGAPVP